jgi:hypothetical protein
MTCSSETSVHARSTWHHIPEDGILHSHCCDNLKSYMFEDMFTYTTLENNIYNEVSTKVIIRMRGTIICTFEWHHKFQHIQFFTNFNLLILHRHTLRNCNRAVPHLEQYICFTYFQMASERKDTTSFTRTVHTWENCWRCLSRPASPAKFQLALCCRISSVFHGLSHDFTGSSESSWK